jgi:hypothetical protein
MLETLPRKSPQTVSSRSISRRTRRKQLAHAYAEQRININEINALTLTAR